MITAQIFRHDIAVGCGNEEHIIKRGEHALFVAPVFPGLPTHFQCLAVIRTNRCLSLQLDIERIIRIQHLGQRNIMTTISHVQLITNHGIKTLSFHAVPHSPGERTIAVPHHGRGSCSQLEKNFIQDRQRPVRVHRNRNNLRTEFLHYVDEFTVTARFEDRDNSYLGSKPF